MLREQCFFFVKAGAQKKKRQPQVGERGADYFTDCWGVYRKCNREEKKARIERAENYRKQGWEREPESLSKKKRGDSAPRYPPILGVERREDWNTNRQEEIRLARQRGAAKGNMVKTKREKRELLA